MAVDVALPKRSAAQAIRAGLGVNMGTLIIIATLAIVLPLAFLTRPSAQVKVRSILNDGADLTQSLLKWRR